MIHPIKRICVFTGSRHGSNPQYAEAAQQLGRELVRRNYSLVYGGGNVGLMKVIAEAVLDLGGHVTGVIPDSLVNKEVAHRGLSELRIVQSMHERKAMMAELSDGFIAMPGGIGTMEEFFEVLSWAQLGIHRKPCGLLNTGGYYDRLIAFLDHSARFFLDMINVIPQIGTSKLTRSPPNTDRMGVPKNNTSSYCRLKMLSALP